MLTPAQFNLFISNINTMVGAVYSDATIPQYHQIIASTMPSTSEQTVYGWTGMLPKIRVWKGSRVVTRANPQTYTLVNQPYEHTLSIDRFRLDDDLMGIYYRQLPDQARQVRRAPDLWMRDLIESINDFTSATVQAGFDGTPHWNTAHLINVYNPSLGTYSNDVTGGQSIGGVTVGGLFSPTALATIFEYMMRLKGEDNEPLGIYPDTVMVPPALMLEANLTLVERSFAPPAWATITSQVGAADNPLLRFGVKPLVNMYLTSATKYYTLDTTKAIKPFLHQVREAPRAAMRVSETDPVVFDTHSYLWGWWGRMTPGWGYAFLSIRSG